MKALCLLSPNLLLHSERHRAAALRRQKIAHGPPVRDLRRNVNQLHPMLSEGPGNGRRRKNEDMFVINLVVRYFLDHVPEVRVLENQDTVRLEKLPNTCRN